MNIQGRDLDLADDRRYVDIFKESAMIDGRIWGLFLEETRADRTLELIGDLSQSLKDQLTQAKLYQKGGDPDWRKRTTNLLRRVEVYLTDVKAEVKRLDREEFEETAAAESHHWKGVVALLADLLDGNPALELIRTADGGMTIAEWRRLTTAKAVAA